LQEVVAGLEQTVTKSPGDGRAWRRLGTSYLRRATESADPTYYGLARRSLDTAATLLPADAGVRVTDGALRLALHDFAGALAAGNQALRLQPESPDALAVVVDAAVELGRYEDAASTLQRLLDLRPTLAALSRVSYLRELHGDIDGALTAMQEAETAGSGLPFDQASIVALQGDLFFNHGDAATAAGAYRRALRGHPGLVAAEIGLARTAAARGDLRSAIPRLQRVIDRVPRPDAAALLGDLLVRQGRTSEAETAYAVVRTTSRLQQAAGVTVDLEMALFEADHGDPAVALDLAQRARAARPTVYAADAVAWALHRAGRDAEALPLTAEALRLGTADAQVRFHAAAVHAGAGQIDEARRQLRLAVSTNRWFSFHLQAELSALATRLGVPLA
jgi:tetratricopeptide (TPR) repeat protein